MKGLLIKDFLTIMRSVSLLLFFFTACIVMIEILNGSEYYLAIGITVSAYAYLSYFTMIADRNDRSLTYLFTLAIDKKDYIIEKFILSILMGIAGFVFSSLTYLVAYSLMGHNLIDIMSDIISILNHIVIRFAVVDALILLVAFIFNRRRSLHIIFFFGCIYLMFQVSVYDIMIAMDHRPDISLIGIISAMIVAIVVYTVMILLSIRLYKPKDL